MHKAVVMKSDFLLRMEPEEDEKSNIPGYEHPRHIRSLKAIKNALDWLQADYTVVDESSIRNRDDLDPNVRVVIVAQMYSCSQATIGMLTRLAESGLIVYIQRSSFYYDPDGDRPAERVAESRLSKLFGVAQESVDSFEPKSASIHFETTSNSWLSQDVRSGARLKAGKWFVAIRERGSGFTPHGQVTAIKQMGNQEETIRAPALMTREYVNGGMFIYSCVQMQDLRTDEALRQVLHNILNHGAAQQNEVEQQSKTTWKLIFGLIAILALLVSFFWMIFEPGLEPIVVALSALGAFLTILFEKDEPISWLSLLFILIAIVILAIGAWNLSSTYRHESVPETTITPEQSILIEEAATVVITSTSSISSTIQSVATQTSSDWNGWVKFPTPLESCTDTPSLDGPSDGLGRRWFDVGYDELNWEKTFEDNLATDIWIGRDGFYRNTFELPEFESVALNFRSDDGSWIYVNGQFVGHWGSDCGYAGIGQDSVDISDYAISGNNLIAIHVHNARTASSLEVAVLADGQPIRLEAGEEN